MTNSYLSNMMKHVAQGYLITFSQKHSIELLTHPLPLFPKRLKTIWLLSDITEVGLERL